MKNTILLFISFTALFSCKKDNKKSDSIIQTTENQSKIKVLDENKDFVIFITPTSKYIDSLKKTYKNEDDFYIIADDANYYTAEARDYILKNNIDTLDLYIDKKIRIGKIDIKLSKYKPWSLLLYRKGKIKNVFPVDIESELPQFYEIKTKTSNNLCNINKALDLINNLPEVQKQSKFVDSISLNKKRLSFMTDSLELDKQAYYMIKTGFSGEFHWETYTIFYINKNNCNEILVDETVTGDIISLKKWRKRNQ
ncbi:hypothetical protein GCM10023210_12700 [Chryseobacterium ginsengisoli]|uniref:Lipoprotein n=1 Tax=Chryseobacterium ginsengisoli TaxID=363853 RepID=A0ABP9M3I3_9FLAO